MKSTNARILAINGGSSSIRFALYQTAEPLQRLLYGNIDRIGLSNTNLSFTRADGKQGNGASLAAIAGGKSIDTSMGFTPAAGLPMSTGSGDLDPGLAPYLWRTEQMITRRNSMSKNIESKSIDQLLAEADELTRQMDSDEMFGMNVEHRLQFNIHTKNLEKIKFQLQSKKEKAISSEPDGMHAAILNIVKAIHGL